ncbi:MAG: hypothetical protein ACE37K_13485 [Planctomycetota bacterium]
MQEKAQPDVVASKTEAVATATDAVDGAEFFLRLVEALAWPLVVLVIVWWFRKHVVALLGRLRSWDSPWGKYEFGEGTTSAPEAAPDAELVPENVELGDMGRRVLNTLWHYQQQHFKKPTEGRWTFGLDPRSSVWRDYTRAVAKLFEAGLVEHDPGNGQVFLSNKGVAYCQKNAAGLGADRFTFPS